MIHRIDRLQALGCQMDVNHHLNADLTNIIVWTGAVFALRAFLPVGLPLAALPSVVISGAGCAGAEASLAGFCAAAAFAGAGAAGAAGFAAALVFGAGLAGVIGP